MEDDGASARALDVDLTRTINFHGITYVVTTRVRRREDGEEVLVVEADQQHTEDRWTGEFTRQYVEEITHKTGNFKKFAVFVRMLLSALQQRSDSVFVDLLTYSDLELLKARKLGQTSVASGTGSRGNNKRYLILTYAVEFDRVHYPLPLVHEDSPSPDAMKRTIRRLKEEIEFLKRNAEDTSSPSTVNSGDPSPAAAGGANAAVVRQQQRDLLLLQKENADLREALRKQMDETAQAKDKASHVALQRLKQENESLRRELYELEESCEEIRENSAQEIRKLRREAKELVQKLQEQQQKNQREAGAGAKKKAGPTDKEVALRRQVAELEATVEHERTLMKRTQAKHRKEMSELVKQLDKEVASGRILRSRNRDLQRKVAVLSAQQSSNRSTTSSRARSQSASRAGSRPGSNYSSRANSTITSRASSRANSTINSRASSAANSRNASRISSRDSSPRFNSSTGSVPRGRVDTSRIYGTYDEHGVNIRKARAKGSSDSREQVPRPTGAAAGGRYRSPYAQPLRSNQRGPAPRQPSPSNGYHSGDSRASSARSAASSSRRAVPPAGATARRLATSDRHRSPAADASRRRPTPLRRPVDDAARSPSPPARARMRQNHLQPAVNGRTSKFDDYEDEAPLLDAPPRRNAARHSPSTGKAGSITRHVDEDEEVYSGQKKASDSLIINGGGKTGAAAVSTKENAPPADSPARGRASSPPAPQARNAWALDQDEAEQPREMAVLRPINVEPIEGMGQLDGAVRKEGPVSSRTDLEVEKGGGDGYGRRPGTAGSLDERGGPAADDSGADFDASSEIGEIDRRLNALQNFLKQAKNGIITRIPTTPRA